MYKPLLLLIVLLRVSTVSSQIPIGVQGAQQIFGAVSSVGREVVRAAEYKKAKEEQEQREAEYNDAILQADALFTAGQYQQAITRYNQALQVKEGQYPRDQIARCNAELARIERQEYQLLIDKADSLYAQLNFSAAIDSYTEALAKKNIQYPKDKIQQVKADQERWGKVHFSGLLISDARSDELSSKVYGNDPYSDFMKVGRYPFIDEFLVYANYQTLDGIAVPSNTRLVIYSERNFKGKVLLDITGPAIINNTTKKNNPASQDAHSREFISPLQDIFPQTVRTWSKGDMNGWVNGSMEISTL